MGKISIGYIVYPILFIVFVLGVMNGNSLATDNNAPLNSTDRQEIMDLIYSYSYTYDSKDLDGWLSLFKDDAIWSDYEGNSSVPKVMTRSNAERRQLIGPRLAQLRAQGIQTRHFMTNTILNQTVDGKVDGITMLLLMWQYPSEANPRPINTGYYQDEFIKTKSGWLFASREAHIDSPSQVPSNASANVSKRNLST